MDRITIEGGVRLEGSVAVSGSKNSTLALMAAALLAEGVTILENVPDITDIHGMAEVLRSIGAEVSLRDHIMRIDATSVGEGEISYDLAKRMRASFYVLGPLLARKGVARVPLPGGCEIGARPIDLHQKGLERLGAEFLSEHGYAQNGYVTARTTGLRGSTIVLRFPSAGATMHLMTTASVARGSTIIENAAEEPEIVDLANLLNAMGARVRGAGTHCIHVEGVNALHGARYRVIPDRLEAGTYLCAAAITRGRVEVKDCVVEHLLPVLANLESAGCALDVRASSISVQGPERLRPVEITTMPFPGFPTDMQQPFGALCSLASGTSIITETLYESRFQYTNELMRMGADIVVDGRTAVFRGVPRLSGAQVQATDLRAGAAMVLAALAADGRSEITKLQYLDRGYEDIAGKLKQLGAQLVRERVPETGMA